MRLLCVAGLGLLVSPLAAFAQPANVVRLVDPAGAADDWFGTAVAIDSGAGNVKVIVGASGDNDPVLGDNSGSATIFRYDGSSWVVEQKLTSPESAVGDQFGFAVAIRGNAAIVGSPLDDDPIVGINTGSATIFRYNGSSWVAEQKLFDPVVNALDSFGWAVAIDGDTAVVGAPLDMDPGHTGSASVFRYNGASWIHEQKLIDPEGEWADAFGRAVAISGNMVIVGAPEDDDPVLGSNTGSATIFRYDGSSWVVEEKLTDPLGAAGDQFGGAVALEEGGSRVIVGASSDDDPMIGLHAGSATVFRHDGSSWVHEQKLIDPDGSAGAGFGTSVALSAGEGGTAAIVGALHDDDPALGEDSGSAVVFRYDGSGWVRDQKLTDPMGAEDEAFGDTVAITMGEHGATAIVGAPYHDDAALGLDAGTAIVFEGVGVTPCACEQTGDYPRSVDVFDLLAYLDMWFAGDDAAELDGTPIIDVFDLLAFLDCWFPASAGGACS